MKLLYVTDALAVHGGIERVLTDKANWLSEHGFDVFILTANQGDHSYVYPLLSAVSCYDLQIQFHQQYHYSGLKKLLCYRRLHHLFRGRLSNKIKEIRPDVIICLRLDYLRDLLKVKGLVPLVFESHSSRLASHFEGDGLLRRLHVRYLQLAVKKTQMVVALTEGDAREWKKLTPDVCVIPNVVHLNESGSYSDCTAKSVIYVGRFSKQKDVGSLLHIWDIVHKHYPDWCLHIYGEYGEGQVSLRDEIDKMGANVYVHGATSAIFDKYKECSILLLTSLYEPFGLVLVEAMSCGLPVVAFDCPYGPAELITEKVDGFLIKNHNIEDFAESICQLIESKPLRQNMGKRAVKSSQRYQKDEIMQKWEKMFSFFLFFSK